MLRVLTRCHTGRIYSEGALMPTALTESVWQPSAIRPTPGGRSARTFVEGIRRWQKSESSSAHTAAVHISNIIRAYAPNYKHCLCECRLCGCLLCSITHQYLYSKCTDSENMLFSGPWNGTRARRFRSGKRKLQSWLTRLCHLVDCTNAEYI